MFLVGSKENVEIHAEQTEVVKSYNLRKKPTVSAAAVVILQEPAILEEKEDEEDETAEEEGFKKPNLANITLARLMPKKSSVMPSSPIAGGNLGPTVRIL